MVCKLCTGIWNSDRHYQWFVRYHLEQRWQSSVTVEHTSSSWRCSCYWQRRCCPSLCSVSKRLHCMFSHRHSMLWDSSCGGRTVPVLVFWHKLQKCTHTITKKRRGSSCNSRTLLVWHDGFRTTYWTGSSIHPLNSSRSKEVSLLPGKIVVFHLAIPSCWWHPVVTHPVRGSCFSHSLSIAERVPVLSQRGFP